MNLEREGKKRSLGCVFFSVSSRTVRCRHLPCWAPSWTATRKALLFGTAALGRQLSQVATPGHGVWFFPVQLHVVFPQAVPRGCSRRDCPVSQVLHECTRQFVSCCGLNPGLRGHRCTAGRHGGHRGWRSVAPGSTSCDGRWSVNPFVRFDNL